MRIPVPKTPLSDKVKTTCEVCKFFWYRTPCPDDKKRTYVHICPQCWTYVDQFGKPIKEEEND